MRFSKLFFPLFAVGYAVAIVAATATYSPEARADFSLSVVGCSSFSLSGNVLTCVPSTSSGVGACTIGVTSAPTTSAGGSVGLSANCSTTFATYGWTRDGATLNSTSNTATDSLPANTGSSAISYSYGLTACNGSTCAPATSVTVQVPAVGGTPAPPPCAAAGNAGVVLRLHQDAEYRSAVGLGALPDVQLRWIRVKRRIGGAIASAGRLVQRLRIGLVGRIRWYRRLAGIDDLNFAV